MGRRAVGLAGRVPKEDDVSRIYATREDDGKRVLVAICCNGCGVEIKPHAEIASSGWTKRGNDRGPGTDKFEGDFCPRCS